MNRVLARCSRQGPATAETVNALHEDFTDLWENADFVPELDRMAFSTAVVEAAANVVNHAVPSTDNPLQLGVDVTVRSHRLEARILEIGAEPPSPAIRVPVTSPVDDDAESGRGMALIRALVNTIAFERHGEDNVWVLHRESPKPPA